MRRKWLIFFTVIIFLLKLKISDAAAFEVSCPVTRLYLSTGSICNFALKYTNHSNDTVSITSEYSIPEGLNLLLSQEKIVLGPAMEKVVPVSISASKSLIAGSYSIGILSKSGLQQGEILAKKIEIIVPEKTGISAELMESSQYVKAGEYFSARYKVENTGNSNKTIKLLPLNCDLKTPAILKLNPGESCIAEVTGHTLPDLTTETDYVFSVQFVIDGEVKNVVFNSVGVLPAKTNKYRDIPVFPVTVTSRYIYSDFTGMSGQGFQFEAFGSGFLDKEKKRKLEFRARGPNLSELSFLGLYDEYYINYKDKALDIFAGDKTYFFTPLIETNRYGRGFENSFSTANGSKFGIVYLKPRYYKEIRSEYGAYTQITVFRENRIGLYALNKESGRENLNSQLGSVIASLSPLKRTNVELEYSVGKKENKSDVAYRVFLNSQAKFGSLMISYFNAGANYPGYFTNTKFYNVSANANILKNLSAGITKSEDFMNAAMDTLFVTAPYLKSTTAQIYYRPLQNVQLRGYYLDYHIQDRMPRKVLDYKTKSINGEINHDISRFGYLVLGELGKTENLLNPGTKSTWKVTLNLRYRPNSIFYLSGFTTYSNLNSFIAENQRNWIWGASASGQLVRNLNINFVYQNNFSIESYYLNRNIMQLQAEYKLKRGHRFMLNSYYMLQQNKLSDPDFTFTLAYSKEFVVPLKKVSETGSVSGILLNTSQKPAKGVAIELNGIKSICNEKGEFSFKNLIPGKYKLVLLRNNLSINEILSVPLPLTVEIVAKKNLILNLKLVNAASLSGGFEFLGPDRAKISFTELEKPNLGNQLVEMTDSLETLKVITDQEGNFSFPVIRPGKWLLKISQPAPVQNFTPENGQFEFVLTENEQKKLSVVLNQKQKKVIFQQNTLVINSLPVQRNNAADKSAQHKTETVHPKNSANEAYWYAVQVASLSDTLSFSKVTGLLDANIFRKYKNGTYLYFSGRYTDRESAKRELDRLAKFYKGAFIVRFKGEELMPEN